MTKRKNNNYKFWHSPIALGILFLILIFFGYKIIDLIQREKETSSIKEMTLDEINILKEKESYLSGEILKLETDEGKEEIIRDKYPVVKEGEKMVIIVDEEMKNGSLLDGESSHGFWNWFEGIFKNKKRN